MWFLLSCTGLEKKQFWGTIVGWAEWKSQKVHHLLDHMNPQLRLLVDNGKCPNERWGNIQKSINSDGFREYPSSMAAVCGRHKAGLYARCLQSKRPLLCHPGSAQLASIYAKKDVKLSLFQPFPSEGCITWNSIAWFRNLPFLFDKIARFVRKLLIFQTLQLGIFFSVQESPQTTVL